MAPAMSGAFITYLAAVKAGGATPLAFILALISCLMIGGVVSEFALHLPSAGSLYTYVTNGLGSLPGFVVGWIYSLGFVVIGPALLAGFGVFTSLVMGAHGAPSVLQQWWVWSAAGLVLYLGLSYFGVQVSTRTQLIVTALTGATLLWLAMVIIGEGGANGNTLDAFKPAAAGVSWPLVFGGLAFGILSFTGFETAAVLAEESRHPRRHIPIAVIGAVVLGGAFYVVVTYATSIGYGVEAATTAWPKSAAGLSALAGRYASYLEDWVLLAGGFASLLCGLGVHNAVARTLFAMGRERVLPRSLGATHRRFQTPHVAILTNLGLVAACGLLMIGLTGQDSRDIVGANPGSLSAGFYVFVEGLTAGTPPIMLCYLLLSIAGIRFGARGTDSKARMIVLSVGAVVASLTALFGSLYYCFVEAAPGAGIPGPYRAVPFIAALLIISGGGIAMTLRRRRPDAWAAMGAIFE
jgi:amino acid transporter